MIYDLICNYFEKMCDDIDFPDIVSKLCISFNIENRKENFDKLAVELRNVFSFDALDIRTFVEDSGVDYPSLIMVSKTIDPEFWTVQTVRSIQNKHKRFMDELDDEGRIKKQNKTQDLNEVKFILLRYFDLLPEEENHDAELGTELLRSLKNENKLIEVMKYTEINISSLIRLSILLTPKYWTTNNGKTMKIKLLKFNSIPLTISD